MLLLRQINLQTYSNFELILLRLCTSYFIMPIFNSSEKYIISTFEFRFLSASSIYFQYTWTAAEKVHGEIDTEEEIIRHTEKNSGKVITTIKWKYWTTSNSWWFKLEIITILLSFKMKCTDLCTGDKPLCGFFGDKWTWYRMTFTSVPFLSIHVPPRNLGSLRLIFSMTSTNPFSFESAMASQEMIIDYLTHRK